MDFGSIGAAAGGVLNVGRTIFGGISASQAMKKVKKNLEGRKRENEAWYNQRYNEDATQRADAQRILATTQERMMAQNRQAAATQAVMGGTEESVAAQKAASAEAMGNAAAQIAIAGDRRKDGIESQYQQTAGELDDKINNMEMQRAGAISQAVQGVASGMGEIGSAAADFVDSKLSGAK